MRMHRKAMKRFTSVAEEVLLGNIGHDHGKTSTPVRVHFRFNDDARKVLFMTEDEALHLAKRLIDMVDYIRKEGGDLL